MSAESTAIKIVYLSLLFYSYKSSLFIIIILSVNAGAEGDHGDNHLQLLCFIDKKCGDQNDVIVLGNVPNFRQNWNSNSWFIPELISYSS